MIQTRASEDAATGWGFFVRDDADGRQQRRDVEFVPERDGVFHSRGATLADRPR